MDKQDKKNSVLKLEIVNKRAEGALREEDFRALIDSLPTPVSYIDSKKIYRLNNRAFEEWFGLSCSDTIGRYLWDVLGQDAYNDISGYVESALSGKQVSYERGITTGDGRPQYIRCTLVPHILAEGEVKGFIALVSDITECKRREKEFQETQSGLDKLLEKGSEDLLVSNKVLREKATLLELAHDAIIVRDLNARITYWNKAAELLYGWNRSEAQGQIIAELLKTEYPVPQGEIETTVLKNGKWDGELIHTTRRNKPIIVESRWALQYDEDGNPIAVLEINRDITARKLVESAVKDYAAKLERSNRELRDFAFIASHDLQEPLRKIFIFGGILKSKFANELGEQGIDYVERMENATVRMQELIDSLLTYSRVTSKTEPFMLVDLGALMKLVVSDLEIPVNETGAQVVIGDLPSIQADPSQLRQLFQNLIGNALKFQTGQPVIKVYGQTCFSGSCQIYVEDNGIGFDEKYLDRIFQPFQRLHGKSSSYRGAGMGLAICQKIVERHNGTIAAKSVPGEGSTFIVSLPLKQCSENEDCAV